MEAINLKDITNPSALDCIKAIRQNPLALEHHPANSGPYLDDERPTLFEISYEAVRANPQALRFVPKRVSDLSRCHRSGIKYRDIVIAAVSEDGTALRYARKQDNEICMIAVSESNQALFSNFPKFSSTFV